MRPHTELRRVYLRIQSIWRAAVLRMSENSRFGVSNLNCGSSGSCDLPRLIRVRYSQWYCVSRVVLTHTKSRSNAHKLKREAGGRGSRRAGAARQFPARREPRPPGFVSSCLRIGLKSRSAGRGLRRLPQLKTQMSVNSPLAMRLPRRTGRWPVRAPHRTLPDRIGQAGGLSYGAAAPWRVFGIVRNAWRQGASPTSFTGNSHASYI